MYVESVAHFAYWMRGKHLSRTELNERLVRRFIGQHLPTCRCARRCQRSEHIVRAALIQLLAVLRTTGQLPAPASGEPEHIGTELDEFVRFLTDVRGVAAPTQRARFLLKWSPVDGPPMDGLNQPFGGRYRTSGSWSIYRRLQGAGSVIGGDLGGHKGRP